MPDLRFNGPDYDPARDNARLGNQLERVKAATADGCWHTLSELARACRAPESSVSAQLRHLRKPRFGSHTLNRRYVGDGLFEYQVVPGLTTLPHPAATGTAATAATEHAVPAILSPPATSSGAPPGASPTVTTTGRDTGSGDASFQLMLLDAA
jgi:hypothetical protein